MGKRKKLAMSTVNVYCISLERSQALDPRPRRQFAPESQPRCCQQSGSPESASASQLRGNAILVLGDAAFLHVHASMLRPSDPVAVAFRPYAWATLPRCSSPRKKRS